MLLSGLRPERRVAYRCRMRSMITALGALVMVASLAVGDDACLTGPSTLGDQRALAAFTAAVEAACPCAAATGRAAYQRCARTVLATTLAAGDLRSACKRTATTIDRGSSCGSHGVACGRFTPSAADPRTCRVLPAASCHDWRRFQQDACTAESHCNDVVDWTASTCTDVRDDGPFVPGVRVITFTRQTTLQYCTGGTGDCTAQPLGPGCICSDNSACASSVCETQSRALDTVIWYPAPAGSGPIDPGYRAVVGAPLETSASPHPLLLFSHGSCGYPAQSTFLTPLLASYGFVVAAPPHPGNTLSSFPNCGSPQALASAAVEHPQDIRFVTDQLLSADQDSSSPFFGGIDDTRVGMSGHSFGGFTTYLVVAQDPRFKVAVPMAPAVPGSPVLTVPSLTMFGQVDSVVSLPPIRTAYDNAQPPKYKVEIADTGHFAFSDGCFPSADCNPPVTLTQDEAHALVLRYVLPFVETYLAGDPAFRPFLVPPAATGTAFDAQP
jgi:predicted dienelactone hydrolase